MTYSESAQGVTISYDRAVKEYEDHGATEADLLEDLGRHDTYDAGEVLEALGY